MELRDVKDQVRQHLEQGVDGNELVSDHSNANVRTLVYVLLRGLLNLPDHTLEYIFSHDDNFQSVLDGLSDFVGGEADEMDSEVEVDDDDYTDDDFEMDGMDDESDLGLEGDPTNQPRIRSDLNDFRENYMGRRMRPRMGMRSRRREEEEFDRRSEFGQNDFEMRDDQSGDMNIDPDMDMDVDMQDNMGQEDDMGMQDFDSKSSFDSDSSTSSYRLGALVNVLAPKVLDELQSGDMDDDEFEDDDFEDDDFEDDDSQDFEQDQAGNRSGMEIDMTGVGDVEDEPNGGLPPRTLEGKKLTFAQMIKEENSKQEWVESRLEQMRAEAERTRKPFNEQRARMALMQKYQEELRMNPRAIRHDLQAQRERQRTAALNKTGAVDPMV